MEKAEGLTKEQIFDALSFVDQAKSINTQILAIEKAIHANLRKAAADGKDMYEVREKYISQLEKIITKIG